MMYRIYWLLRFFLLSGVVALLLPILLLVL